MINFNAKMIINKAYMPIIDKVDLSEIQSLAHVKRLISQKVDAPEIACPWLMHLVKSHRVEVEAEASDQ